MRAKNVEKNILCLNEYLFAVSFCSHSVSQYMYGIPFRRGAKYKEIYIQSYCVFEISNNLEMSRADVYISYYSSRTRPRKHILRTYTAYSLPHIPVYKNIKFFLHTYIKLKFTKKKKRGEEKCCC